METNSSHPYDYLVNFYGSQYRHDQPIGPDNVSQLEYLRTHDAETKQAYDEIMTNRAGLYGVEPRPAEEWQAHLAEQAATQAETASVEALLGQAGCAITVEQA